MEGAMRTTFVLAPIAALCFTACASNRVPSDVNALAHETMTDGEFIVELAPDGGLVSIEAWIPLDDVPRVCRETAEREVPGGREVYAEKEIVDGVLYYEVVKEMNGIHYELLMHPDGRLAGREDPLPMSEWPAAIVNAAKAAVPPGQVVACERVSGPEAIAGEDYHVKIDVGGEVQRVSVTNDGRIIKVIRKMKAEVRVPR